MSRQQTSLGAGRVALIVSLAVVVYSIIAGYTWFTMRMDNYALQEFTLEKLKFRGTVMPKDDEDSLRDKVHRKAEKLGIKTLEYDDIEVENDGKNWRIHFEYVRKYKIPGITRDVKYEIDEKWNAY